MREGNFLGEAGHACGFLFNFSKVTENAIITIKLLIFFHIVSDVAMGSENSPSLTPYEICINYLHIIQKPSSIIV